MLGRLARYAHTLRHVRPGQITGRLWAEGRRAAGLVRAPAAPRGVGGRLHARTAFVHHDAWNTPDAVAAGVFTFLDQTRRLGQPIDWTPDAPLLWRFNLHYLQPLAALSPSAAHALMRSWMGANPPGTPVAWHPYPTAMRLTHALTAGHVWDADVQASLYRQAGWLARTMESYHPGNHLIENARALVLAGEHFAGHGEADAWAARARAVIRRETPDQVLADGAYFERSPMYHALMLHAWCDVLNATPPAHPDASGLASTVRAMAGALVSMCHPDGQIALFNDATLEIAPPPSALLDYAERLVGAAERTPGHLPAAGLYRLAADGATVLADFGAIGPDYLPAHAHADILSFEASFGGLRFVTDTGVSEYAGARRAWDRGTPAHNTVSVDGRDQAEVWSSFRVARRWPPTAVSVGAADGVTRLRGLFDGWSHLVGDGLAHRREMILDAGARCLTVVDDVSGTGAHDVVARLHLHPEVTVRPDADGYLLARDGVTVRLRVTHGAARWTRTRYSPRFGSAIERDCLEVSAPQAPARLAVRLHF